MLLCLLWVLPHHGEDGCGRHSLELARCQLIPDEKQLQNLQEKRIKTHRFMLNSRDAHSNASKIMLFSMLSITDLLEGGRGEAGLQTPKAQH